ncbi:hypothetical protein BHE74_00036951 [Ensete ventricosum]|nr:hypothetical protein GW17_00032010 [Ensete ventricosum]RWW56336.1 hypothetical protein BHE74_00036951 [Ensete ventricosum]RZS04654.1 hypothetical protein BHM03_00035009 [Ensete ventricosum]
MTSGHMILLSWLVWLAEVFLVLLHQQVESDCPMLHDSTKRNIQHIAGLPQYDFAVTFPLDLVRRRKQLEGAAGRACVYKSGIFGTFRHIIRTEGFRGLYRGILPEYYKVVPGVGIVFMTYETLKSIMAGMSSVDE